MDKNNLKAYIVKDGDTQILVIPEAGGFFGKEGFCDLNHGILENLIKKAQKEISISQEKVDSFKKRSEHRKKMTELFSNISGDIFEDDGFVL